MINGMWLKPLDSNFKTKTTSTLALAFVIFSMVTGCQREASERNTPEPTARPTPFQAETPERKPHFKATSLLFAEDVDDSTIDAIERALSSLDQLEPIAPNPRFQPLFQTRELSSSLLRRWFQERVKIAVSDTFSLDHDLTEIIPLDNGETWSYPATDRLPNPRQGLSSKDSEYQGSSSAPESLGFDPKSPSVNQPTRLMTNLGAMIYWYGKKASVGSDDGAGRFFAARFSNHLPELEIVSPRVGLVRIGAEFSAPQSELHTGQENSNPSIDDAIRLSILFHEARHSDGHGRSLGFMHSPCPKGHDYEGLSACDFAKNGPYMIAAAMIKLKLDRCTKCSSQDLTILRLVRADQMGRLIQGKVEVMGHTPERFYARPADWDTTPEFLLRKNPPCKP